jgi:eukaryotic-like serine/threonine-protein kinase
MNRFINKIYPKLISAIMLLGGIICLFSCASTIKLKAPLYIDDKSRVTYGSNITRNNISKYELTFPLEQVWEYSGNSGISPFAPAIADSTIFIGFLNGELHALNIFTGKKIGNVSMESAVNGSPFLERNAIYVPLANSENSLRAYDLTDGKLKWKKKIGGMESSPLVIGQNLFTASNDGEVQCIDKNSSNTKWKFNAPKEIHSTLAADSSLLFIGCDDGYLYSINMKDGSINWKFLAGAPVFSVPAIAGGKVYFGAENNRYFCVNIQDGLSEWMFDANSPVKYCSAVSDSSVYFTSVDGALYSLNKTNGKLNWTFKAKSVICAGPSISGKYILISSFDKKVYILEKETGKTAWEHEFEGRVKTTPVFWNGYLIVCYEDYNIMAFRSK